jgi:hypothetical protein
MSPKISRCFSFIELFLEPNDHLDAVKRLEERWQASEEDQERHPTAG